MKIETDKSYKKRKGLIGKTDVQRFPPIHITLESPEECDCLWHFGNYCGDYHNGHYLEDSIERFVMSFKEFERIRDILYEKIDGVWDARHKE